MGSFLFLLLSCSSVIAALPASSANLASIPGSTPPVLTKSIPVCTDVLAWFPLGPFQFDAQNCEDAIKEDFKPWMDRWGGREFRFGKAGSTGEVPTPQKFQRGILCHIKVQSRKSNVDIGLCTIAIVMLDEFEYGEIPEDPGGATQSTDISTYADLYHSASIILKECLKANDKAGWLLAGLLINALGP